MTRRKASVRPRFKISRQDKVTPAAAPKRESALPELAKSSLAWPWLWLWRCWMTKAFPDAATSGERNFYNVALDGNS